MQFASHLLVPLLGHLIHETVGFHTFHVGIRTFIVSIPRPSIHLLHK